MAEGQAGAFVMKTLLVRFLHDQAGATAIEYALIASSISIVIVGAANGVGTTVTGKYSTVSSALR
jgi:pilus assembly protein Flp/PilA